MEKRVQPSIQRLRKRISELEAFDPQSVKDGNDPDLLAIETAIGQTISDVFGHESADWRRYNLASDLDPYARSRGYQSAGSRINGDWAYRPGAPDYKTDVMRSVAQGRQRALSLLKQAISGLEERGTCGAFSDSQSHELSNKVFVVHGHDEGARDSVARFLTQLDFEPIILHEQANRGRTIITKFREEAVGVGFAVVLMTPDDHGGKLAGETKPRARQNVVFELGFFIGALGPEKVVALVKGEVEKPSDFDGVVYISLDDGHWKIGLAKELKAAGLEVDLNKVIEP